MRDVLRELRPGTAHQGGDVSENDNGKEALGAQRRHAEAGADRHGPQQDVRETQRPAAGSRRWTMWAAACLSTGAAARRSGRRRAATATKVIAVAARAQGSSPSWFVGHTWSLSRTAGWVEVIRLIPEGLGARAFGCRTEGLAARRESGQALRQGRSDGPTTRHPRAVVLSFQLLTATQIQRTATVTGDASQT